MSIEVRILDESDAPLLNNIEDGVFDGPVDPSLGQEFLADPRHHLCVATDSDLS